MDREEYSAEKSSGQINEYRNEPTAVARKPDVEISLQMLESEIATLGEYFGILYDRTSSLRCETEEKRIDEDDMTSPRGALSYRIRQSYLTVRKFRLDLQQLIHELEI